MHEEETSQRERSCQPRDQELDHAGSQDGENNRATDLDVLYKHKDLRIKRWQLSIQIVSLMVAAAGFFFLWSSVNGNTRSLGASVQNNLLNHEADLNKLFRDNPWLYPYFYENKTPDPNALDYQKLEISTIAVADVLDIASIQSTRYPEQWEDPEAWDTWTCDLLKSSPMLREYLRSHRSWYNRKGKKGLIKKLDQVDAKTKCE